MSCKKCERSMQDVRRILPSTGLQYWYKPKCGNVSNEKCDHFKMTSFIYTGIVKL